MLPSLATQTNVKINNFEKKPEAKSQLKIQAKVKSKKGKMEFGLRAVT